MIKICLRKPPDNEEDAVDKIQAYTNIRAKTTIDALIHYNCSTLD